MFGSEQEFGVNGKNKIRVLIVDDSASVRQALTEVLNGDPEIEVMGTAGDPYIAARLIQDEIPGVIVLDVEMPRMDGITFLRKIMQQRPMPVVICSSLTEEGSETFMQAIDAGAVEVILKPRVGSRQFLLESRIRICDAVKAAAVARLRPLSPSPLSSSPAPRLVTKKLSADVILPPPDSRTTSALARTTERVVCIGASTGGTESLRVLLEALPADAPGTAIVQHMPEHFTTAFAKRLDSLCAMTVKEAANGDNVLRGQVLIAPGNHHMLLKRSGARYYVEIKEGPLVSRHRPSVDVLFRSAARYAGSNALGILMTGMGDDGARGLLEMLQAGAQTIAEDESSCVVFGMPREAIKLGAAQRVVPLERLRDEIVRWRAADGSP
ncbi:MAG: chemotaxis response regulator protein-glutamate methylesterase [Alphaproteobacteria bacterium]|nr:chemotaxis response regulator protein-glutamate methylesterase [Alphaproteobacteria bacterium]